MFCWWIFSIWCSLKEQILASIYVKTHRRVREDVAVPSPRCFRATCCSSGVSEKPTPDCWLKPPGLTWKYLSVCTNLCGLKLFRIIKLKTLIGISEEPGIKTLSTCWKHPRTAAIYGLGGKFKAGVSLATLDRCQTCCGQFSGHSGT